MILIKHYYGGDYSVITKCSVADDELAVTRLAVKMDLCDKVS